MRVSQFKAWAKVILGPLIIVSAYLWTGLQAWFDIFTYLALGVALTYGCVQIMRFPRPLWINGLVVLVYVPAYGYALFYYALLFTCGVHDVCL